MTTRRQAEALLDKIAEAHSETTQAAPTPQRRRVDAIYCPVCSGWVEVRLQPVRLRCTRCGVEARP